MYPTRKSPRNRARVLYLYVACRKAPLAVDERRERAGPVLGPERLEPLGPDRDKPAVSTLGAPSGRQRARFGSNFSPSWPR
jgi:hypothetical protein